MGDANLHKSKTVVFWFDVDDSGSTQPNVSADRYVKVSTITSNMGRAQAAAMISGAATTDSQFTGTSSTAGIVRFTHTVAGYHDATPTDWTHIINLNQAATFLNGPR